MEDLTFIEELLEENLTALQHVRCKPVSTTLLVNFKLSSSMYSSNEVKRKKISRVSYASAVGSLMFAMICTRPDIAQAVEQSVDTW